MSLPNATERDGRVAGPLLPSHSGDSEGILQRATKIKSYQLRSVDKRFYYFHGKCTHPKHNVFFFVTLPFCCYYLVWLFAMRYSLLVPVLRVSCNDFDESQVCARCPCVCTGIAPQLLVRFFLSIVLPILYTELLDTFSFFLCLCFRQFTDKIVIVLICAIMSLSTVRHTTHRKWQQKTKTMSYAS